MRIGLVTGDSVEGTCGVRDYTHTLAAALERHGVVTEIVTSRQWGVRDLSRIRDQLRAFSADITHVQYPSTTYGMSLAPHAIAALASPSAVTVHEVRQAHPLRKASLLPLASVSQIVVFTSTIERTELRRLAPWIKNKSCVVPIGSMIPVGRSKDERVRRIVFFGLVTPEKGLDDVLELARLVARSGTDVRVTILGNVPEKFRDYHAELVARCVGLPVDWMTKLDGAEIADVLAETAVAYLPYPDGASERRGSLLAALTNGVATISTSGPFTTDALVGAIALADEPARAWEVAQRLLDTPDSLAELGRRGQAYAARFDWNAIAERHVELYDEMTTPGRHRPGVRHPGSHEGVDD
jgi:glycosyltransferase involved in cell wall biosynthesis